MNYKIQKIFYIFVSLAFSIAGFYFIDEIFLPERTLSNFSRYSAVVGFAVCPFISIFCIVSLAKGWTKEEEAEIGNDILNIIASPIVNIFGFAIIILNYCLNSC